MTLSERENYLRNAYMIGPEWIPCSVGISDACWDQLRDDLTSAFLERNVVFIVFCAFVQSLYLKCAMFLQVS